MPSLTTFAALFLLALPQIAYTLPQPVQDGLAAINEANSLDARSIPDAEVHDAMNVLERRGGKKKSSKKASKKASKKKGKSKTPKKKAGKSGPSNQPSKQELEQKLGIPSKWPSRTKSEKSRDQWIEYHDELDGAEKSAKQGKSIQDDIKAGRAAIGLAGDAAKGARAGSIALHAGLDALHFI